MNVINDGVVAKAFLGLNRDEHCRYLPEELIREVCARLPVKSLLRFRCVCKSWYSLISSPTFVSYHLTCYHDDDDDDDSNTPFFAYGFPGNFCMLSRLGPTYHDLSYTQHNFLQRFVLRGHSVNGLLLISSLNFCPFPKEVYIMLWNPSIRKLHKSPFVSVDGFMYFGLGYSHASHGHKVVVITPKMDNSVRVYTVGNHTWRRIDNYRDDIIRKVSSDGVFTNGCVHWISGTNYVVLFDVDKEEFNYMSLPSKGEARQRHPVVYRKLLELLELGRGGACNLWVMRNGEQGLYSWSKMYTIELRADYYHPFSIKCFSNGQMILADKNGGLMVYDFERKEMGVSCSVIELL